MAPHLPNWKMRNVISTNFTRQTFPPILIGWKLLSDYYRYGIDNFTNYENTMNGLTPSDIRKFAKTVFGQKNKMEFVLLPKKITG